MKKCNSMVDGKGRGRRARLVCTRREKFNEGGEILGMPRGSSVRLEGMWNKRWILGWLLGKCARK